MPKETRLTQHKRWMRLALELAQKGKLLTSPNPMVGACVVRAGKLVSSGYHQKYGGDHAEVIALKKAGARARGATLYVTLEPCSTWGKTPPCTAAVLNAGIKEVIVGSFDPNPRNHGTGIRALKKEGIRVIANVLSGEVEKQNEAFFKYVKTRLPFITLKMAQSLDGKIATYKGLSRWISSPASREFVHRLRAEQDAILVGGNTLRLDDPLLSPRLSKKNGGLIPAGKPWRVALDKDFKTPASARIFKGNQLTFLAVSEKRIHARREKKSFTLIPVAEKKGRLDLKELLRKLADLGVAKLLVEGGGELAWSLINEKLVDKIFWIVAPKILGVRTPRLR